jgi:glycosyltransferase involved in cell wall biosynthesis
MNYIYDFSIIIPAHNATEYINTALDSIIWQNYDFKKVEVIVIDDGSNDNLKS